MNENQKKEDGNLFNDTVPQKTPETKVEVKPVENNNAGMANPNGIKKPTDEKPAEKNETGVAVNQPSKSSLAPVNNESRGNMDNVKKTVKSLLSNESMKRRFEEILADNAAGFTANLSVMVSNSAQLSKCEPISVISSAIISASLKLPLDGNLGFAALVPYGDKCTFQIQYKGLIQLCQRSGQYQTIGVTEVHEGQLVSEDPLRGYEFDWKAKKSDNVVGYAAYFKLVNGFEKTVYWDIDKIKKHGLKYSQMYKRNSGLWVTDFDSMAKKTVLKNLLSKWGIMSIDMQKAVIFDQSKPSSIDDDAQPIYIDAIDAESVDVTNDKIANALGKGEEAVEEK